MTNNAGASPSRENHAATAKSGPDRLPALDGVRAFAATAVLLGHLPRHLTTTMARDVGFAMDLFFVLSGFLITRILLADRAAGRSKRRFYLRRALRIFPAYYLMVVLCWVAVAAGRQPALETALATCYLYNFYYPFGEKSFFLAHSWSLCVEEHFYLFWPLVIYGLPWERARRVAIAAACLPLLGLAALLYFAVTPGDVGEVAYSFTLTRAAGLAAGAVLAFEESRLKSDVGRTALLGLGVAAAGLGIDHLPFLPEHAVQLWRGTLIATGIILLVLAGQWSGARPAAALAHPLPAFVGRISYGLYLYHLPIYIWLGTTQDGPGDARASGIAVAATFAAATASYYGIERPLLRLRGRMERRPASGIEAPAG